MNIKPIETVYNGYRFRSRLEAKWAVFFDAVGIEYYYEPEGIKLSDGTYYLPDFYLPKSKQWFEVKGVMKEDDEHKIKQLIEDANVSVAVGHPDMTFQACDKWWDGTYQLADKYSSILVRCRDCGGLWFMGTNGNFECPCCGEHDGDHHLGESIDGDGENPYRYNSLDQARVNAKQARFEHGETPDKQLNANNHYKSRSKKLVVDNQHKPQPVQPRFKDLPFIKSEQEVISYLIRNDTVLRNRIPIKPEDFDSPFLGRIYGILRQRIFEGKSVCLGALEGIFDAEEIYYVATIVDQNPVRNINGALEKFRRKKRFKEVAERLRSIEELNKLQARQNEIISDLIQGKAVGCDCDLEKELKEIEEQIEKYIVRGEDGKKYLDLRKKEKIDIDNDTVDAKTRFEEIIKQSKERIISFEVGGDPQ